MVCVRCVAVMSIATLSPYQSALVACWRKLREPFVLPHACNAHHKCEWQRIDIDLFGCTLCSSVHACSEQTCQDKIETEDGIVCRLSGIALRTCRFVEEEFMDNVHLTDYCSTQSIFDEELCSSEIEHIVWELLTSRTTRKIYMLGLLKQVDKMKQLVRTHESTLDACVQFLCFNTQERHVRPFNLSARKRMAESCVADCYHVMRTLVHAFKMHLKFTDTINIATGTLYLMRAGVHMHGLCVVPQHAILKHMLPPESTLDEHFGIRPKSITDAENHIKFSLRTASSHDLLQAGFKPWHRAQSSNRVLLK